MGNGCSCRTVIADATLTGLDVYPEMPSAAAVERRCAEKERKVVMVEEVGGVEGGGEEAYSRAREAVLRWDVYGGSTTVYVPGGRIEQGKIIGIATTLLDEVVPLSFEDVSSMEELDVPGEFVQLQVSVTTREENIVDGNYNVHVKLFRKPGTGRTGVARQAGDVEVWYQKRQNLRHWIVETAAIATSGPDAHRDDVIESARKTIARLKAFAVADDSPPEVAPLQIEKIPGLAEAIVKHCHKARDTRAPPPAEKSSSSSSKLTPASRREGFTATAQQQ